MALTTFGAIMSFAAEMFRLGEESLQGAAQHSKDTALRELLQELLLDERKNRALMERLRREYVTEMILEPIQGLRKEDYEAAPDLAVEHPTDSDLLRLAIRMKEKEIRFLEDCSAKIPLPEAAGAFRKILKKTDLQLQRLRGME